MEDSWRQGLYWFQWPSRLESKVEGSAVGSSPEKLPAHFSCHLGRGAACLPTSSGRSETQGFPVGGGGQQASRGPAGVGQAGVRDKWESALCVSVHGFAAELEPSVEPVCGSKPPGTKWCCSSGVWMPDIAE